MSISNLEFSSLVDGLKVAQLEVIAIDKQAYKVKKELEEIKRTRAGFVFSIEKEVLLNPEYKNENQRKVAISELVTSHDGIYELDKSIQTREDKLIDLEADRQRQKSEIEYNRNLIAFTLNKGV